jgi:hypothetical protein
MTHSNNYKPVMIYLTKTDAERLKRIAKKMRVPVTQIAREAITARISAGDPYVSGFNNGIDKALATIESWEMSKMRFSSGASFGEVVSDLIIKQRMKEAQDDEGGIKP